MEQLLVLWAFADESVLAQCTHEDDLVYTNAESEHSIPTKQASHALKASKSRVLTLLQI